RTTYLHWRSRSCRVEGGLEPTYSFVTPRDPDHGNSGSMGWRLRDAEGKTRTSMGISPQRILSFNHGGVYRRPWHERARKRAPASRQAPVRDVRRRAGFY